MLMNDLIKTEFFVLMNEKLQEITNEELQHAYGKFITLIDTPSAKSEMTLQALSKS